MKFYRIVVPFLSHIHFPFYETEGEHDVIVSEETYISHKLNYTITSWDEKTRLYQETLGRGSYSRTTTSNFFDEFRENSEIDSYMESLLGEGMYKIELSDKSHEGNSILAYKFNKTSNYKFPKLNLLVSGTLHAREWLSPMTSVYIAHMMKTNSSILDFANVFVIPVVNVDGYKYTWSAPTDFNTRYWRKNRQIDCESSNSKGVDLNRNFNSSWGLDSGSSNDCYRSTYRGTSPFSASETFAVKNFVESIGNWDGHIDIHAYASVVLGIFAHTFEVSPIHNEQKYYAERMAMVMKNTHGYNYRYSTQKAFGYTSSGVFPDWMYRRFGAFSYTFEMRPQIGAGYDGFAPPKDYIPLSGQEGWNGFYQFANDLRQSSSSEPFSPLSPPPLYPLPSLPHPSTPHPSSPHPSPPHPSSPHPSPPHPSSLIPVILIIIVSIFLTTICACFVCKMTEFPIISISFTSES